MNLKINFAVCLHFLPCAMARHTAKLPFFVVCLSTWHTAKVALFAVCLGQGTRQRGCVCRVPSRYGTRQTGCSTGLRQCTLFCCGPNNAHGKVFALCSRCSTQQTSSWHTANRHSQVVFWAYWQCLVRVKKISRKGNFACIDY